MLDQVIGSAKNWILNSGIQNVATQVELEGGFNAWFNLEAKSYPYLYTEITGYGITTLLFLNKILKKDIYIQNAKRAADWIIHNALHSCGGVRTRFYYKAIESDRMYSFESNNIFSFDTGMALYGMINLYRVTQDEKYFEASKRMAEFLIHHMQNDDGSLSAIFNPVSKKVFDSLDKWSSQASGYHAKVAMGLTAYYKLTNQAAFKDAAVNVCEFALTTQDLTGRFITDKAARTTNVHAHCYTAEGLLFVGGHFEIDTFIQAARQATEWSLCKVSDVGISELYDASGDPLIPFQRSDIFAQVLRLASVFTIKEKREHLLTGLLSHHYSGGGSQDGGFFYSKTGMDLNACCTMFALQALMLIQDEALVNPNKTVDYFV